MGNQMSSGECQQRMQLLRRGYESFDEMGGFKDPDTEHTVRTSIILTFKHENYLLKKMCGKDVHLEYINHLIDIENTKQ
jgi:hypothetical protein